MNYKNINTWYSLPLLLILSNCSKTTNQDQLSSEIDEPNRATQIVNKSIEKHGGWNQWENTQAISYKKTIILFDSTGAEESKVIQFHNYHQFKPDFQGKIEWVDENNDSIRIVYKDGSAIRSVNETEQLDSESTQAAVNSMMSSLFVLFQPFKLLDPGTDLQYLGEDVLEDGRKVYVVQPVYGGWKEGDDRWWFYFDTETYQLVANMVNHMGRYSYIKNLEYDTSTELVFNHHRKSFFTDSLRNVKYLRAEYFYEDFELESKE